MFKSFMRKSQEKRYNKFLSEYKSFSDELLWSYYCGLDMDSICGASGEFDNKMYYLVEEELEKRNNPKFPTKYGNI